MSGIYRFSPIKDKDTLDEAFSYVASKLDFLSLKIFKNKLAIDTLKIFPHYPEEYDYIKEIISGIGPKSEKYTSETSFYVEVNKKINGHNIELLGVRIVDPYRTQVGCGDWTVENYSEIKAKYLGKTGFMRDTKSDTEMLEVWHPDLDVLGYVVLNE